VLDSASEVSRGGGGLLLAALLLATVASAGKAPVLSAFRADAHGERAAALTLARFALDAYCLRRERIQVPAGLPTAFAERSGVFVSAMLGNAPRCCMGALYPTKQTVAEEIIAAACAAAGNDLRFPAVKPSELGCLRLIVSVIAPPEAISNPWQLDPVTEGLAARSAKTTGVVLPGETPHRERMVQWARTRSGAEAGERGQWFRVRAVRVIEAPHQP
jgi:AMMECR1 domain-containing protein